MRQLQPTQLTVPQYACSGQRSHRRRAVRCARRARALSRSWAGRDPGRVGHSPVQTTAEGIDSGHGSNPAGTRAPIALATRSVALGCDAPRCRPGRELTPPGAVRDPRGAFQDENLIADRWPCPEHAGVWRCPVVSFDPSGRAASCRRVNRCAVRPESGAAVGPLREQVVSAAAQPPGFAWRPSDIWLPTWARTGSIDGQLTAGATQMATEQLSNQNNRG